MDNYIALGDSISISSYPSLDAGLGSQAKVGAADLLGESLIKMKHVHTMRNLACDGASIMDAYRQTDLLSKEVRNACNVITLTIGGNDISYAGMEYHRDRRNARYEVAIEVITNRFETLVEFILNKFPNSILVLNTLYDPTDGTGKLPDCGSWSQIAEWYSKGRRQLGRHIETSWRAKHDRVLVVDIFSMFDGHGMREGNPSARWYYRDFMIEPGCNGAKYIFGLWLHTITQYIAESQQPQKRISFSH